MNMKEMVRDCIETMKRYWGSFLQQLRNSKNNTTHSLRRFNTSTRNTFTNSKESLRDSYNGFYTRHWGGYRARRKRNRKINEFKTGSKNIINFFWWFLFQQNEKQKAISYSKIIMNVTGMLILLSLLLWGFHFLFTEQYLYVTLLLFGTFVLGGALRLLQKGIVSKNLLPTNDEEVRQQRRQARR